MGKKNSDIESGDDIWNISASYVQLQVMLPIRECAILETTAQYGTSDIDNIIILEEMKPRRRVEALYRYKDKLRQLITNVAFIIRKSEDKTMLENLRDRITLIEKYLDGSYSVVENHVNHTSNLKINESFFHLCLSLLMKIKEELNTPINNANLIFRQSGEIDLDDIMKDIEDSG